MNDEAEYADLVLLLTSICETSPPASAQDMHSMIDAAKYADLVLLLIDAAFGFEMETFEFLNLLQVITSTDKSEDRMAAACSGRPSSKHIRRFQHAKGTTTCTGCSSAGAARGLTAAARRVQ